MIKYFDIENCKRVVFPFIQDELTDIEPCSPYESEQAGMQALETVLTLMRNNDYYPTLSKKAAYLVCAIAGAQHFTNGNKRLSVALLLLFLAMNEVKIPTLNQGTFKRALLTVFPLCSWEESSDIRSAHPLFLYNLAKVIGDPSRWIRPDFNHLKERVGLLFSVLYEQD